MFHVPTLDPTDPDAFYETLAHQLEALLGDETDRIANLANAAALIWHTVPQLNWAGFYLLRDGELVLGPFQGKPACVRIEVGKGVCGTAVAAERTIRVEDVHQFPGHIACDDDSRSELVVPLRANGRVIGVLDLDSPVPGRFTEADQAGFERMAAVLEATGLLAPAPVGPAPRPTSPGDEDPVAGAGPVPPPITPSAPVPPSAVT